MKKRIIALLLAVLMAVPMFTLRVSAANYESAWFPAPTMRLTQLAYENASHGNCNAIDLVPGGDVFAPFTGKIVQKSANWGYVLFQSLDKVYFADGSLDYMTVGFMHDSNISDLSVGQVISQGTPFYQAGGMGYGNPNQFSAHVDISVFRGKVDYVSSFGKGDTYAYNAFLINRNKTTINNSSNFGRAQKSVSNGAPTNWSNLWRYLSDTASLDLNGRLDGSYTHHIIDYGTVDVYINGTLDADDCTDYYKDWPVGTRYEIKDIKSASGCVYNGVADGAISGTVAAGGTNVRLDFSRRPTAPLDLNGRLDGSYTHHIIDYGTVDVYINGTLDADDCTDYYKDWPVGTRYEIKDIKSASGCAYNGVADGAISGTIAAGGTNVRLDFSKRPTAPAQRIGEDFYAYIYSPHGNQNLENAGNYNVQTANVSPRDPKQIWHFLWDYEKSTYKIINLYDGGYLDAPGKPGEGVINIKVSSDNGDLAQRWTLCSPNPADNMFYIIPSYVPDHSLVVDAVNGHVAMPAGTNVQLGQNWYGMDGSGHFANSPFHQAQTFQINKISDIDSILGTVSKNIGNDFYGYIHFPHGTQNLESYEGNVQTASVDLRDPHQMWHFVWDGEKDAYKIINEYDGKCLQTSSDTANAGANVLTGDDSDQAHQRWIFYGTILDENRFFIVPSCVHDRSVTMDVWCGNVDKVPIGTNIQIYTNWYGTDGHALVNGGPFHAAQTFQIVKLPTSQKPDAPAAPASVTAKLNGSQIDISWSTVPTSGNLDTRAYELEVTQGSTQIERKTLTGTSCTVRLSKSPQKNDQFTVRVRAVNTKYQDCVSAYAQTNVTVAAVTPRLTPPSASIQYGQTLSSSILAGGAAVDPNTGSTIAGTWSWDSPDVRPDASGVFQAVFTPKDTAKYNTPAPVNASVTVNPVMPELILSVAPQQAAGTEVVVNALAKNPNNATLEDVPGLTLVYYVRGEVKTIQNNRFTIPADMGADTVITVRAQTSSNEKYLAAEKTATITVTRKALASDLGLKVSGWAQEEVDKAIAAGLYTEVLNKDMTTGLTRAQAASVMVRLYEAMNGIAAPEKENPFRDTDDPNVLKAYALGLIDGDGKGNFNPDGVLDRQTIAVMLAKVYRRLGGTIPMTGTTKFADNGKIASWARADVAFMSSHEVIQGDGVNFNPSSPITGEGILLLGIRMMEKFRYTDHGT